MMDMSRNSTREMVSDDGNDERRVFYNSFAKDCRDGKIIVKLGENDN